MELPAMAQSLLGGYDDIDDKRFRPVVDLDVFFKDMYHYHYNKGLPAIILTEFCGVCSLGFTVSFSVFLLGFVNWAGLMDCHDEGSCHDLHTYIVTTHFGFSSIFGFVVMGYCSLFSCYWIFRCVSALQIISNAMEMERFYREKLGINLQELQALDWNSVVQRLIALHEHKIHRVAVKDRLTEHDVVSRIMRKENYMVALINKGVLDLRLPWWASPFLGSERLFLTKSLEWSLYFCVLQHIFNDQFNVSSVFLRDVKGLQSRFLAVGVVHFLLLPFMLVFMVVHFFLQNASQFHSSKAYLGPRQWSPLALWTFREFNELSHVFETRMNKAYGPANSYVLSFSNPYLSIVARCAAYICGSFVAVLLLASVIDEAILLYVHTSDHNLLWYLGICTAAYAGARSMVPDDTKTASAALVEREELLDQITAHTHYSGEKWIGRANTCEVRDEILEMFPFKAKLFFVEVMSVVFTPVVLCFSLPHCASDILEFIRDHSAYIDGVGAVCDYCTFDLDKYGDEDFGTVPEPGHVEVSRRPVNGKMEQSFLSFQQVHPDWAGGGNTGRDMLNRLRIFRAQKETARDEMLAMALQNSMSMHMSMAQPGRSMNLSAAAGRAQRIVSDSITGAIASPQSDPVNGLARPRDAVAAVVDVQLTEDTAPPLTGGVGSSPQRFRATSDYDTDYFRSMGSVRRMTRQPSSSDVFAGGVASSTALMSSGLGHSCSSGGGGMPSILRSVLKRENIDYENDFYWLSKFQRERKRDPLGMEQSLMRGMGSTLYGVDSALNLDPSSPQQPRPQSEVDHCDILLQSSASGRDGQLLLQRSDTSLAASEISSDGDYPAFSDVEHV